MKFTAQYLRNGETKYTRKYATSHEAQDALAKRIGHFHYLGSVAGDSFLRGVCEYAPRNGGLVSVHQTA